MKSLRVAHLPHNVGNHAFILSLNEKKDGKDSVCFVSEVNYLNYPHDERCWSYEDSIWKREFHKWLFLFRLILKFDVVHFNFGKKIFSIYSIKGAKLKDVFSLSGMYALYCFVFQEADLFLLKLFRKKIFVTFQGDDARQGDYCRKNFSIHFVNEVSSSYYTDRDDRNKRKLISIFDKYADQIFYLNPDLGWVLPKRSKFIPYLHVRPSEWTYADLEEQEKLTLVHAPTNQLVKGSKYLMSAAERLKKEGFNFDLILVENMTFDEAVKVYRKADIVVDQVLAGWYGGLAVEAMALGKPVVSYIRREDLEFIPQEMKLELPIIEANPDSIYEVLKGVLTNRYDLKAISRKSRSFIEKWHNSEIISKNISNYYLK